MTADDPEIYTTKMDPLPKELEKDFFTYILNHCDITKKLRNQGPAYVRGQGDKTLMGSTKREEKTERQREMEIYFKICLNNISINSMFK